MQLLFYIYSKNKQQNYEASISQLIDWNDDPFGQDLEHDLMDNILKRGDDPTVNKRDLALTTPLCNQQGNELSNELEYNLQGWQGPFNSNFEILIWNIHVNY